MAATFIKELTNTLNMDGPVATLTSWPLYAVIVSSVASGLLVQAALHVGPLTVSQPLLVVIDPIVSIWLSVWLFAEYFHPKRGRHRGGGVLIRGVDRRCCALDTDRTPARYGAGASRPASRTEAGTPSRSPSGNSQSRE